MGKITIDLRDYGGAPELGYELLSVIPYAYKLHKEGKLAGTVSTKDTACLYHFSPNHYECPDLQRGWKFTEKYRKEHFPNIQIHQNQLDWSQWSRLDYGYIFQGAAITFPKETIVICNRYNVEWGEKPINFFPLDVLRQLFITLQDNYQIVYCNLGGIPELTKYDDDAPAMQLGDYDMIKKEFPKVIHIYDLHKEKGISINNTQMRVFAGCSKFITMNGGYGIWASYMGGENIIYSKRCRELTVNSFYSWYWKLGRGNVTHVDTHESLLELVKQKWVDKLPLINILLRTSHRPQTFDRALNSILSQSYKNVRVIVGCDNQESFNYALKAKCNPILYKPYGQPIKQGLAPYYGSPFGPNVYFNRLAKMVRLGIVVYLDDDDYYLTDDSLMKIAKAYKDPLSFITWRVLAKDGKRIVPSDFNFTLAPYPEPGDFSGLGYAHHIDKFKRWTPWRRGDYRQGVEFYRDVNTGRAEIVRIDEVLVAAGRP
jgi:hypothetical protein